MKIKELHQKSEKELKDLLAEKQERLGRIKFDLVSKKLKNIREIREVKKDIARILTLFSEQRTANSKL
ncbi:MAG: 50S ribosomal protein L29 [Candidatus Portnoybacteria bacterium RIFCSPLOWO2_12_FULL_39_9]|uniref:Large ribosomal subunit protein uL29 n=1 Tax=Candidatus Portnoybacteria bacterium RIFCSPHIGHO2_12_FULL_38_9 TaxID=1801997 RepID=A0A1G2FGT2_9BACT|nr:MAG: 50S ribosomal protein L29 [Candidatus Portnoybacteria bacterium RBG_13_40_8]OGZ36145.1 MAG: 50S ribosomal protein L29 [Candidatus Portnoybacteria bacterium RIFCSPHIGHO2_02_FULL_39_12]OGZ37279.1 MAG: 50S ribosomal protein L29 [Candidatus Portnoybacteria bacterium RIFCSPHIGHO2_12_FULL_38_9]OGZ38989.1 MAG: 50S ribosomal protein L29 [Candidatus Portnoybacteria bacterium RIFCSPLOWO2_01_FULL_38_39]OGZ40656.1 MAG: 50S ribosomal protein L29 [Candidatus Portnoybacteria bacterium RIFCSPLOWO2_12_F